MRRYRALCRKCSSRRHPEFRDHEESNGITECKHCGYKLESKEATIMKGRVVLNLGEHTLSLPEDLFPSKNYELREYNGRSPNPK